MIFLTERQNSCTQQRDDKFLVRKHIFSLKRVQDILSYTGVANVNRSRLVSRSAFVSKNLGQFLYEDVLADLQSTKLRTLNPE